MYVSRAISTRLTNEYVVFNSERVVSPSYSRDPRLRFDNCTLRNARTHVGPIDDESTKVSVFVESPRDEEYTRSVKLGDTNGD